MTANGALAAGAPTPLAPSNDANHRATLRTDIPEPLCGRVAQAVRTSKGGQSALLLLDVVDILRREKVDYAVIGAFALTVLGVVRATTDVDALLFTTQ